MRFERIKITKELLDSVRSERGGWTARTLSIFGIEWPPKRGWRRQLLDSHLKVDLDALQEAIDRPERPKGKKEVKTTYSVLVESYDCCPTMDRIEVEGKTAFEALVLGMGEFLGVEDDEEEMRQIRKQCEQEVRSRNEPVYVHEMEDFVLVAAKSYRAAAAAYVSWRIKTDKIS